MDPTLLMILVTVVIMVVLSRTAERIRRRENPAVTKADRIADFQRASDKLNSAIRMFRDDLDSTKLRPGRESYTHYYCAYLCEIGKAISRHDQVEFDLAFRAPILTEVTRVCDIDDQGMETADKLINHILTTEYGKHGAEDGRIDAEYALSPTNTGPYWSKLEAYFEDHAEGC